MKVVNKHKFNDKYDAIKIRIIDHDFNFDYQDLVELVDELEYLRDEMRYKQSLNIDEKSDKSL